MDAARRRAQSEGMHVLAVRRFSGTVDDLAPRLAAALGISAYEARGRVRGPAPRVVATFADPIGARVAAAALQAAGFDPLLLGEEEMESEKDRVVVRSYALDPLDLVAAPRAGPTVVVPLEAVELLLRGTRLQTIARTVTTHERRPSVGKALITGGLVITKDVRRAEVSEQHEADAYLHAYAPGHPVLAFSEAELVHVAPGRAREPSRAANFTRLVTELRARASGAAYDDRLLTRAGQAAVLGGVLGPEQFPDVAISVLARTLRRARSETEPR